METKLIMLDTLYGLAIYLTEKGLKNNKYIRNRGRIVCDKNNVPAMFNNINIAVLMAEIMYGLNKNDFRLKVIKYQSNKNKITEICNFESMQVMLERDGLNTYQVITNNRNFWVAEQRIDTVQSIRYCVFENGDVNHPSKKYGKPRNRQLLNLIRKAATEYFYVSGILSGVRRFNSDCYEITFKNTSTRVYFMTNGLIAYINKTRKSYGISNYRRCLPFVKSMDTYTTLYSYVSREDVEPDGFGYDGEIDKDIERFYAYIEGYILDMAGDDHRLSSFKYHEVDFNGTILIKESGGYVIDDNTSE